MALALPNTLIHWVLAASAAAAVAFFGGGLTLYFERGARPAWVLAVHYSALLIALLQLAGTVWLPVRSDAAAGLAIGMQMAALLLFLSAIEAAKRTRLQRSFVDLPLPDRLITDGPFKWVRHPFCTGYVLASTAGAVGIADPIMIVLAVPLVVMSILAAVREERVWLSSPRSEEYRQYRRRTGMFVPFIRKR